MPGKFVSLLLAVSAVALPSSASATTTEWTANGETLKANVRVYGVGSAFFESATLGGVSCKAKAIGAGDLIAGSHNVTVRSFTNPAPTTDCGVTGFLGSTCGKSSLTELNLLKHAVGTGTLGTKQVDISGIELLAKFGSCLSLVLTGSVVATANSETAVTTVTISGELETNGFGKVKVGGHFGGGSGTYGIKTF